MSKWHFIAIALSVATGTDQLPKKWNDWYSRKGHRPTPWNALSEFEEFVGFFRFCFKFWRLARADRRRVKASPHPLAAIVPSAALSRP